jgi:D-galactarolactone cycloisomerase
MLEMSPLAPIVSLRWRLMQATPAKPIRVSFGGMSRRQTMFVELLAADGTIGIGETWVNYPTWAAAERAATLEYGVGPRLVGATADHRVAIAERLRRELLPYGRQAGAVGPILQSIAGIEMALLDLEGRQRGLPAWRLLRGDWPGGELEPVPVYASGLDDGVSEEELGALIERGYASVKLKCGFGEHRDRPALERIRRALPDEIGVMVDANQGFDRESAMRFGRIADDHGVLWFEEPISADDWEGLAQLRAALKLPLALGENWYGTMQPARALAAGACDILQPDLAKTTGFSELPQVVRDARAAEAPIAYHNFGSALGVIASLHAAAAYGNCRAVEIDATGCALADSLFADMPRILGGRMAPPGGPGLGVRLSEAGIADYQTESKTIQLESRR